MAEKHSGGGQPNEARQGREAGSSLFAESIVNDAPFRADQPASEAFSDPEPESAAPSQRLPRTAIIVGLVSLLSDTSSELVYPLLPLFVTQVLSAPAAVLGLIEGVAVGTASVVSGISGWISDIVGRRKPIAFIGYALTSISRPMIALASAWPLVLAARFFDRFGKGIRTAPRDALVAEASPQHLRGKSFGFERAMDSAGAVIGPLLAVVLVNWAALNLRTIFLLSAVPASIGALLMLTVKERKRDPDEASRRPALTFRGTTPEYKRLMVIIGVFGLANSANAFLILRAQQIGLAIGSTIIAYAVYNAMAALASMPAGAASDRLGRRNLLLVGYMVYAVSYVGFALAQDAWLIWPLFALYGLYPALTDGVAKALAVDTCGSAGKATAIGIYSTIIGVTQVAASYVGGLLWDKIDPRATFYFGGILAAIAAGLALMLLPSRLQKQSAQSEA